MTWTIVFVLAAGVWAQRFLGMYVGGPVLSRFPALGKLATLIPAAVVMAVIVQLTVASGTSLVFDARVAGMAAAGVLVGGAPVCRGGARGGGGDRRGSRPGLTVPRVGRRGGVAGDRARGLCSGRSPLHGTAGRPAGRRRSRW